MDLNEIPSDHIVNTVELNVKDGNFEGNLESSRSKCSGIEEQKCREVGEKCLALELEIRKRMMDLEGIRARVRDLEAEKGVIEEEVEGLKKKKAELEGVRVDDENMSKDESSLDDWSKVDLLMIENKVLECEKMSALKEVEDWKRKCKELELCLVELEGKHSGKGERQPSMWNGTSETTINGSHTNASLCRGPRDRGEAQMEGTPFVETPENQRIRVWGTQTGKVQHGCRVKKRLLFRNERGCNKKFAPSTPEGAIDIIESDDEHHVPGKCQSKGTPSLTKRVDVDETVGVFEAEDENINLFIATPKRKRGPKVVLSDDEYEATPTKRAFKIDPSETESEDDDAIPIHQIFNIVNGNRKSDDDDDDDDDIPISQLKLKGGQGSGQPIAARTRSRSSPQDARIRPRKRLVKSQPDEEKRKAKETETKSEMATTENVEDDTDSIEDGSDSDANSMRSFIDDDSEIEDVSKDGTKRSNDPEEVTSDSNLDYGDIISILQRRKDPNSKWVFEADMLSDFGKDPELCMRAVCVLYRQQTADEKRCKGSIIQNGRGFSKFDATRGTKLGEFLTDGDPDGNLKRSVNDLRLYDPDGVEACHRLAKHYSKQLFEIYKNKEDSYFPSP